MYKDFIIKQTSDFDSQFKAKTLVGNWYEERCNPKAQDNYHFYRERRQPPAAHLPVLTQNSFQTSTSNWLNFQNVPPTDTFKSQYQENYKKTQQQKRLSVLKPFIMKKSDLVQNKDSLTEYRQKWTKSKNVFDQSRTAIGHAKQSNK